VLLKVFFTFNLSGEVTNTAPSEETARHGVPCP
jgi:hypothetical protein